MKLANPEWSYCQGINVSADFFLFFVDCANHCLIHWAFSGVKWLTFCRRILKILLLQTWLISNAIYSHDNFIHPFIHSFIHWISHLYVHLLATSFYSRLIHSFIEISVIFHHFITHRILLSNFLSTWNLIFFQLSPLLIFSTLLIVPGLHNWAGRTSLDECYKNTSHLMHIQYIFGFQLILLDYLSRTVINFFAYGLWNSPWMEARIWLSALPNLNQINLRLKTSERA